ncbi:MAG: ThuA domain-containing protein [Clostridia bacterium]|nr:ThuA domain-containing protein [Clostridia bacterium]MBR1686532.1 ThuA domain-containing protein [Clostridia bacterium]MBR2288551.1 ThuA domain-containing protein [Clostridia bacterium]
MAAIRVLLLADDLWHPAEVIERGLSDVSKEELDIDIVRTAKDIVTADFVRKYDVLVNCKGDAVNASNSAPWFEEGVTEFGPRAFREYVEAGGGLVVIHSGLTVHVPEYVDLVGGEFITHPPREEVHYHLTAPHPIAEGVEDFTERDEPYQIAVTASDARVFMERTSAHGGTCIAGYTREVGKGRIAVLTPGHTLVVWQNPQFRRLFTQSIRWAMAK